MINRFLCLVMTVFLFGCGTAMTLIDTDGQVSYGLENSYCKTIPYIYSGVMYDFCFLNGKPKEAEDSIDPASGRLRANNMTDPLFLIDFLISGAVDTVVIPYTLYRHVQGDYIVVKSK